MASMKPMENALSTSGVTTDPGPLAPGSNPDESKKRKREEEFYSDGNTGKGTGNERKLNYNRWWKFKGGMLSVAVVRLESQASYIQRAQAKSFITSAEVGHGLVAYERHALIKLREELRILLAEKLQVDFERAEFVRTEEIKEWQRVARIWIDHIIQTVQGPTRTRLRSAIKKNQQISSIKVTLQRERGYFKNIKKVKIRLTVSHPYDDDKVGDYKDILHFQAEHTELESE